MTEPEPTPNCDGAGAALLISRIVTSFCGPMAKESRLLGARGYCIVTFSFRYQDFMMRDRSIRDLFFHSDLVLELNIQ